LTEISVAKREAEIKLDETDFYEKKMINKRKKLILEGQDPDEIMVSRKKKHKKTKEKESKQLLNIDESSNVDNITT